jgi:hypothetical protein
MPQAEGRILPLPRLIGVNRVFPKIHRADAVDKLIFAGGTAGMKRSSAPSGELSQPPSVKRFSPLWMAQGNLFVVNLIRVVKLS